MRQLTETMLALMYIFLCPVIDATCFCVAGHQKYLDDKYLKTFLLAFLANSIPSIANKHVFPSVFVRHLLFAFLQVDLGFLKPFPQSKVN